MKIVMETSLLGVQVISTFHKIHKMLNNHKIHKMLTNHFHRELHLQQVE